MTQHIKKGLCLTLTLLLALSMTVPAFASGLDTGMPPADVIYNTDNWPGETLILDENKTVKSAVSRRTIPTAITVLQSKYAATLL